MSFERIPYLAAARFAGDDAGTFLQSQLSADVLALGDGEQTFAAYCTPKGKVLGLLLVARQGPDYLVAARDTLLPGMLRRLQMYVLRSRVTLEMESDLFVLGAAGPTYRFEARSSPVADAETWRASELRAGIAWLDEAVTEKFIPQMLGHEAIGAVSFQKGCYPGQEIVARARYLGKVKRQPVLAEIVGSAEARNGEKVRLSRNGDWSDAVLVEQARDGERTVLFTVAASEPAAPVEAVKIGDRSYRCATT